MILHRAFANANPSVTVYDGLANSKATLPWVVLNMMDAPNIIQTEGDIIENIQVAANCYAKTEAEALQMVDTYVGALNSPTKVTQTTGTARCMGIFASWCGAQIFPEKIGEGDPVWRGVVMVTASFQRTV